MYSKGDNQRLAYRCPKIMRISAPAKPTPAPAEEIMTVAALARYFRCNKATVYRLLKTKQIPAFKLGGGWHFSRSAIDEWMAARQVHPPESAAKKPSGRGRHKRKA
jgi:excisionase family DNA binding protein